MMLAATSLRMWLFVVLVGRWIFEPLEHIRRWGLICGCKKCNERRAQGEKHVQCDRNGCRLKEAWEFLEDRIKDFQTWGRTITREQCEGSQEYWELLQGMCKYAASELRAHFKHLNIVPWSLSQADSIAGAKAAVDQVDKQPLENHDTVTQDFLQRVGNDLRIRAAGGDASTELVSAVRCINNAMLNEAPGEGYHRETNFLGGEQKWRMWRIAPHLGGRKMWRMWRIAPHLGGRTMWRMWRIWRRTFDCARIPPALMLSSSCLATYGSGALSFT